MEIKLAFDESRARFYWLRGPAYRDTFFNPKTRERYEFDTTTEALAWARALMPKAAKIVGEDILDGEALRAERQARTGQYRLF